MLLKCVVDGGEPELSFRLRGAEYMIIAYADRCSFQRCADEAGANASGERYFTTLRELYATRTLRRATDRRTLAQRALERSG